MNTKITNKISTFVLVFLALIIFGATIIKAAPGDLDLSFGSGGIVVTPIINAPYFAETTSMQVQPDGKIVVGGRIKGDDPDGNPYTVSFFLARYHPNGTLDASFGTNGKIVAPTSLFGNPGDGLVGEDIALQSDGKILAVGIAVGIFNGGFAVNRYNSDGTLDASFGTGGRVITPVGYANKVAVQADGKIVVVGQSSFIAPSGFAVVRYNPNGSLDTSFGVGGRITTLFGGRNASASAVMLQPDGKIVVAGNSSNNNFSFALARYNADGSLDSGFGVGGKVVHTFPNANASLKDAVLQPDGRIVVVGHVSSINPKVTVIVRYNANGSVDTSFAQNGIFTTEAVSNGIALQSNGKIVAFGYAGNGSGFAIVRLNPNGTPDTSFGANGSGASGGAIQSDGKILAFGWTNTPNGNGDIAIVRYLGDSTAPRPAQFDFNGDGSSDLSIFRPTNRVWYLDRLNGRLSVTQFGLSTDKITPADFDGDGKTDIAVFRDGAWYWLNSSSGAFNSYQFGSAGDIPVPFDYTGDGRAELAVYRGGTWYTLNLANNQFNAVQFGIATDKPVVGDYDGDRRADYAVYRDDTWYLLQSTQGFGAIQFGISTDKLVPADYDGDGKTDAAVYRDGTWYILGSTEGFSAVQFGLSGDIPVAADYDGDGKTDVAVFRDGFWHLLRSQQGLRSVQFGTINDKPIPAAFTP